MNRALLVVLALSTFVVPVEADVSTQIDAFAKKAMQQIGTAPGLGVVVVRNDKVVYRGDFGLRDVDAKLPITPDTHFFMASTTKAFLAMTAAILADEGKLDLDAPVSAVWADLKLTAPLDPKRLSLRDFLAMRSGLGNDTLNFRMEIGNVNDERELLRVLETYSREEPRTFRYSNASYVLAARVVERAAAKPWFELVNDKILSPLGMTSTVVYPAPAGTVVANCYRSDPTGRFVTVGPGIGEIAGPAGGMLTTTNDISKWLIALLREGRVGERQVLSKRAVRMVQSAQTTNKRRFRYFDRFAWGLGQDLGDYEGDLLVHRFGGLDGAYSHVSFMPERGIAVAAFSNGGGAVPDAVAAYAYDLLLGKENVEAKWTAELAKVSEAVKTDRARRLQAEAAAEKARKVSEHPPDSYAAAYHYDRLGDIVVTVEDHRFYARLGNRRAELIPTGGEVFLVDWTGDGEPTPIKFVFGGGDQPARIDWGGRLFDRVR